MTDVIGMDPVAWSIDGGRHPGDLLRVLAYAATQGGEGVIAPGDCRVRQLSTAGPQIRIDSGAVAVRNRSSNIDNQTYIANNRIETRLDVAPTTGSIRSDLVVVRMRDPQFAPWTNVLNGASPLTFQYAQPVIIPNVPAGTTSFEQLNLGYSGYALARIDIPANTTNITDAMVKTLRKVAVQRRQPLFYRHDIAAGSGPYYSPTSGTGFAKFPGTAALPDGLVTVPDFATKAVIRVTLTGLALVDGPYRGFWKFHMFRTGGSDLYTWQVYSNEQNPGGSRNSIILSDDVTIPSDFQGQTVNARLEFSRGSGTGRFMADGDTQLSVDLDFYGAAI